MKIALLILVGFIVGVLNSFALKFTIKKLLEIKHPAIVVLSFFIRMTLICMVFFVFLDKNWKNAAFMLLGLTISKILFILLSRKYGVKK